MRAWIVDTIRIAFRREPWWAEFWSGSVAVAWGVIAFIVGQRATDLPVGFNVTPFSDQSFRVGFAVGFGVLQMAACLVNHTFARRLMAVIGSWFWTFLVFNVSLAVSPLTPGVAVYSGWAMVNVFSVIKLRKGS